MININAPVVDPVQDKVYWNSRDLLTVHELSYLLFDTEPNPYKLHVALVAEFEKYYPEKIISPDYQDSVEKFEDIMCAYYKIAVHAKSLPAEVTDQTHVAWYHQEHPERIASYGYEPRFLVAWIQDRGFTVPSWFKPRESIYESQRKPKIQQLDSSQIMIDGWFNTKICEAVKLVALTEAYAHVYMKNKERNKKDLSSGEIKDFILKHYDVVDKNGSLEEESKAERFAKGVSEIATHKQLGSSLKKKATN